MKKVVLGIAMVLVLSMSASASIIPTLTSGPTLNGFGDFSYGYTFLLGGTEKINVTGDAKSQPASFYFSTIFDFLLSPATIPTFVTDAGLPAGASFAVSVQNIGITPPATAPIDNPGITNITLRYSGTANIGGGSNTSDITLGVLTARSPFNQIVTAPFHNASQAEKHAIPSDPTEGDPSENVTAVTLPSGVPEPTTMFLFGTGLIGLAMLRRRFGKS
jgi:hypothetical protein